MTHNSLFQQFPTSSASALPKLTNDREMVLVIGESCFNNPHTFPTLLAFVTAPQYPLSASTLA
jgi:hypothetical protein